MQDFELEPIEKKMELFMRFPGQLGWFGSNIEVRVKEREVSLI